MRNRRFDDAKRVNGPKNQVRHHRSFPQSGRFPAMSAVARALNPVCFWQTHAQNIHKALTGLRPYRRFASSRGTKRSINYRAVNRNIERFPERFRLQLSQDETNELVTNCDRLRNLKHSSILPRPLPLYRRHRLSYRGLAEGLGQKIVRLQQHGDWG